MSDQQTNDLEEVKYELDELFKIADNLKHWVLFELILTIGSFVYILHLINNVYKLDFISADNWLPVMSLIVLVRAILLFRVWYSSSATAMHMGDTVKSKMTYNYPFYSCDACHVDSLEDRYNLR